MPDPHGPPRTPHGPNSCFGLASNQLGLLPPPPPPQAVPYVWSLYLVPMHYFTHLLLLFCTGLWTANIHDCIHGSCEPIMVQPPPAPFQILSQES